MSDEILDIKKLVTTVLQYMKVQVVIIMSSCFRTLKQQE